MMKNRVKRQGGVCVRLLPGIVLICFAALLLGGCGKARSPKLLARQAKSTDDAAAAEKAACKCAEPGGNIP